MLAHVSQINDFYSKHFKSYQTIASRLLYTLAAGVKVQDIREAWLVTRGSWGATGGSGWRAQSGYVLRLSFACCDNAWEYFQTNVKKIPIVVPPWSLRWTSDVKPATHPRMQMQANR